MTTALIVVDVQNDFVHPDGNLYVVDGDLVPARVNELLDDYDVVVYTKDFHPAETGHFEESGGPWPTHCVGGTWGAEFHDDLVVRPGAPRVYKGTEPNEDGYSGFTVATDDGEVATVLQRVLDSKGVDTVHIVGIALDVCVKATALDAVALGYDTTVIYNATAAVTPQGRVDAVEEMIDAGVRVV